MDNKQFNYEPSNVDVLAALRKLTEVQTQNQIQLLEALKLAMIPSEWRTTMDVLAHRTQTDDDVIQSTKLMIDNIGRLGMHIATMTEAINTLATLQQQQTEALQQMQASFIDTTARVDVLSLAIQRKSGDDALADLYGTSSAKALADAYALVDATP